MAGRRRSAAAMTAPVTPAEHPGVVSGYASRDRPADPGLLADIPVLDELSAANRQADGPTGMARGH